MSDIKDINDKKPAQNTPIDTAVNKLKESAVKDLQTKINEKVKAALDAKRILETLTAEIKALIREQSQETQEFNDFLKALK